MAKITRALQKIFGGSLSPSGNIAKFGSLAAGSPAYTGDPVVLQSLSQYDNAWGAAVLGQNSPAIQDRNALDYLFSRQLAYLMQAGLPEWDAATTYYFGSWCQVGGVPYIALTDANINKDPVTQTNDWRLLASSIAPSIPGSTKAWIYFNAQGGGSVYDAFNATLTRLGTGNYQINFPAPIPYMNYTYALSCNQDNSSGALVGVTRYPGDTKTQSALQIRLADASNGTATDVSEVNVQIWSA
jgi:hypothetical protein